MQIKFTSVAEVVTRIVPIIAENLNRPATDISLESKFETDLGADSLDKVALVMDVEDAFDITVPEADVAKIQNVGQLVAYVAAAANDTLSEMEFALTDGGYTFTGKQAIQ